MIKNLKDLIIVALVVGVLSLLGIIIIGDYYVALQENRPVDESVITLMMESCLDRSFNKPCLIVKCQISTVMKSLIFLGCKIEDKEATFP